MRWLRLVALVTVLGLLGAGCEWLGSQVFGQATEDRPVAMATWGADWEPLEEIVPPDRPSGALVVLLALNESAGSIEGEVTMVRMTAEGGTVILDHRLPQDGRAVPHRLPPGDYLLEGYYRVCDGNCGYLDPPEQVCSVQVSLADGMAYLVEIGIQSGCGVTEDEG